MFESFQEYWQSRRPLLDDALAGHISLLFRRIPARDSAILHLALNGGKKLRGTLLGMIAEILGGEWKFALPRAVAVELIQAATLIHDDFVDQDRMRRDMPAVWTLEGARRAVLLGDVIFADAIRMMSELGSDDGRVVSRAIAEISKGALMEPDDPALLMEEMEAGWSRGVYEKIIRLKTGVLFEAACELGAISAGVDSGVRERCMRYGSRIGEAYQMADDIKEIRRHLEDGSIHSHEIALLSPAILFFTEEARPQIKSCLGGGLFPLSRPLRQYLRFTVDCMEREIRRRLDLAVEEMREALQEKRQGGLGIEAPANLLALFNLS